jgi:hypothetical protein
MPQKVEDIEPYKIKSSSKIAQNKSMDTRNAFQYRKSKYPLDFEVQGNPFTLVNKQGISDGLYMNKTLNDIPL